MVPHSLQRFQGFQLMLFQFQMGTVDGFASLLGQIVLNLPELGMAAQKNPQLILYRLRLNLHLPYCPAVHIPAQVNHAVLFQKVIIELPGGYQLLIMGRLIVNLDCHSSGTVLQHEVRIAAVLINVVEMVLGIQIPCFFCAKCIAEQLYEQILRSTAGGCMIGRHKIISLSL